MGPSRLTDARHVCHSCLPMTQCARYTRRSQAREPFGWIDFCSRVTRLTWVGLGVFVACVAMKHWAFSAQGLAFTIAVFSAFFVAMFGATGGFLFCQPVGVALTWPCRLDL